MSQQEKKGLFGQDKPQQEKGYLEAAQEKAGQALESAKDTAAYVGAQASDKANEIYYKGESGVAEGKAQYYAGKQDVRAEAQDVKKK